MGDRDRESKKLALVQISKWKAQGNLNESSDDDSIAYEDTVNTTSDLVDESLDDETLTSTDNDESVKDNLSETKILKAENNSTNGDELADANSEAATNANENNPPPPFHPPVGSHSEQNNQIIIMATGPTVSEILKDISSFTGKLPDVNKFISSCRAGYAFVDATKPVDVTRFINGLKNKLDSATFNTVAATTFATLDEFVTAIERIFLISNDPSTIQIEIMQRVQKYDESVMTFANKLLEKQNEYIMLYRNKRPDEDAETIKHSIELMLTHSFLRNLKQPFKNYAKGHFFTSFDDAKKWALDVEKLEQPRQDETLQNLATMLGKLGVKNTTFKPNLNNPQQSGTGYNFRGNQSRQNIQRRTFTQGYQNNQPRDNFSRNFQQFQPRQNAPQQTAGPSTGGFQFQPRYNGTGFSQQAGNASSFQAPQSYAPRSIRPPQPQQNSFQMTSKKRKRSNAASQHTFMNAHLEHQMHNNDYPHSFVANNQKN